MKKTMTTVITAAVAAVTFVGCGKAGEDVQVQGKRIAEAKQARDARARKAFADMKGAMQEGHWQDAYDLNVRVAVEDPDFPGRREAEREINNHRPDYQAGKVDRQIAAATEAVAQAADMRQTVSAQTPDTIEYKLAVVDAGTYVRPEDIIVARFRSLLSQLSTRWRETPTRIADMSVATKQQLRKVGVDQKILGFLEGMNLITPVTGKDFPEYASLYVVMRSQGQSHEVALAALRIARASDFPR